MNLRGDDMYDKSKADYSEERRVAFRGSFLMSPRIQLLREEGGVYRPPASWKPEAPEHVDRKHFVLFPRN